MGRCTVVWLAVMALAYCGDSGSPTAPSILGPGGSLSGATVQGTVNTNRLSAAFRIAADHKGCDHLTVEVVGTIPNLSVEGGCNGRFVITGVPGEPGRRTLVNL